MTRVWLRAAAFAALAAIPRFALAAESELCAAPTATTAIIPPLERLAARIAEGGPLTVVAVGSSSTSGIGASAPDHTYPNRLEAELRARFPQLEIHVLNRGKGGEDVPEELARLAKDVVDAHPDLVIWQVGTNTVLRRDDLATDGEMIRRGINLLTRNGIDVVLMDLQYAPRVLERPGYRLMENLVADAADEAHVGLFRRFDLMRYWQRVHATDMPAMVGADGLHMTDAGYGCLAAGLAGALEANWHAGAKLARRERTATGSLAGLAHPAAHPPATAGTMRRNDATPFD
jgi:acyl-CoA thioesterase I